MHTISSVNDIATYLQNNHPDLLDFDLVTPAVAAIQAADHPRWGSDWSEWLGEHARAIVEEVASANGWTYEGYWNTVLGAHSDAARIVAEYDLAGATERDLDEWLGGAQSAAWAESGRKQDEMPAEWRGFHARALEELVEALAAANVTTEQIAALRDEAGAAGDLEQVELCERALAGDERAALECRRVILDARAQS